MPLISVVIPAYNCAGRLNETLDSVAAQTHPDVQVIVVDDGSTDDTARLAEAHPVDPLVVRQTNSRSAVARNRGTAEAEGEWVAFLDDDDLWHQEHLSRALALADISGAGAVALSKCSFLLIGEDHGGRASYADVELSPAELQAALTAPLDDVANHAMLGQVDFAKGGPIASASCVMAQRSLLLAAGGFPSVFSEPADVVCWFQIAGLTPFAVSETTTTYYRLRAGAQSEGSEKEVRAMAAYVAMFYGNTMTPYRGGADGEALRAHGEANATHKLQHLLSQAASPGELWRGPVADGFSRLLVTDAVTAGAVRRIRRRRRLEQAAPGLTNGIRRVKRRRST